MAQKELAVGMPVVMAPSDVAHFTAAALTQYRVDVDGLPDPVRAFQIGVYVRDPQVDPGPGVDANKDGQPFVVTTPYDGVKNVPKIGRAGDAYVRVLASPAGAAFTVSLAKRTQPEKWGVGQAVAAGFRAVADAIAAAYRMIRGG